MSAQLAPAASTATPQQVDWFRQTFDRLVENIDRAILGKDHVTRLALTCLLSEGHLLLEDFPGTGKTQLARALAASVQGSNSRIQFTPDLLPSDVTGVTIYDPNVKKFEFHPGPIFATIVLADEINRASPKTQSALLEVMEEGRVTVDGVAHDVGDTFMVIATQNPIEQAGTYRLPEAQLDRFLMKTSVGYPDADATMRILGDAKVRDRARRLQPVVTSAVVGDMAALADEIYVDPALLGYVTSIAEASRRHPSLKLGLSVRGCLAYVRCAKTWAASQGRTYVIPDDIKMLAMPVLSHRLLLDAEAQFSGVTVEQVVEQILGDVPPPVHGSGRARGGMPVVAARSSRPDPEELLWPAEEEEAEARTLHRTPNPQADPHTPHPHTRTPNPQADPHTPHPHTRTPS
jgi:MoxR-like ATPase